MYEVLSVLLADISQHPERLGVGGLHVGLNYVRVSYGHTLWVLSGQQTFMHAVLFCSRLLGLK